MALDCIINKASREYLGQQYLAIYSPSLKKITNYQYMYFTRDDVRVFVFIFFIQIVKEYD